MTGPLRCGCDSAYLELAFAYDAPPLGETRFDLAGVEYRRDVHRCTLCGHFISQHELALDTLYGGDYVSATYGGDGLREAFERIVALPPERSDNAGRVQRILEFADGRAGSILDVGSGLCVFLHEMKRAGWTGTALDPDPRAAQHARTVVGVDAVCGDFMTVEGLGRFDAVTLNKVLEHVVDPVAMLARCAGMLDLDGFVYLEVPDGEAAAVEGPGREEFFIEHLHVFSPASLALLVDRAGFSLTRLERLREPSTKYTLAAFLRLPAQTQ